MTHDPAQALLPFGPLVRPRLPKGASIADRFAAFHAANPHVYDGLRVLALDLLRAGVRRFGVGLLYERLRWERAIRTGGDTFTLNNDFRALYARLLVDDVPSLAGALRMRQRRTA